MTTTDTPRTDAAEMPIDRVDTIASRPACVVHTEVARQLERELAKSQEAYLQSVERDDYLTQALSSSKTEVDRLQSQLKRAVEIADKIWADCSNGSEHTELAALKGKIK